ncbi:MAG: cation diffusion facilitator family transporter [Proteobacteria bacterium]|nr:cation diffusion facilitator family transporter [Desulfocapsa sp.]MBU3944201.1 cation diffusion facilitator family transporter [Pseudomonadota bacterium]MCG2745238.1 cation diffusion facilitator family transporter [Desulfobacteraceae bacterium]MBU4028802.1 cation diffusion facilitator family transporter [Pseudomonadota bacterium]MBU4041706.1 cation diffusion facilitator family transporter [Pseudomonadota bacterium]
MNETPSHKTGRLLKRATYASVATALLLVGSKFGAWLATGSLSILASLIDSLMDVMASFINLMAIRYSLNPADDDHSFGHGKAEALAGLAQASFIAGSALILFMHGIERLKTPVPIQSLGLGLGIMVFSILATLILIAFQRYVIKQTNSTAIRADSLHYATDLLTNVCTIIALLLTRFSWGQIMDPIFSMIIALIIFRSAWQIGSEAVQLLMDHQLPREQRELIQQIVHSHQQVLGMHDLRTRQSGQIAIIQLHLDLNADLPLSQAHSIGKDVEQLIWKSFPGADVTIHQDPMPASARIQTS